MVDDLATVVWLANLADLELHTPLAFAESPKEPTMIAFDLDPGPPATIVECAEVACRLRDAFDHFGLAAFPKTSGSKGMQLYVPLNTPGMTYDAHEDVRARGSPRCSSAATPSSIVSARCARDLRPGKVFIDWSQNDEHKTTVSRLLAARARAADGRRRRVTWDEVEDVLRSGDPDDLAFTSDEVLDRVAEHGDRFAPVLEPAAGAARRLGPRRDQRAGGAGDRVARRSPRRAAARPACPTWA